MSSLREQLADLEHSRWSDWMNYLFSVGTFNKDNTWTMPAWATKRWQRQMTTKYQNLSDAEKDNDRKEADKTLTILHHYNN